MRPSRGWRTWVARAGHICSLQEWIVKSEGVANSIRIQGKAAMQEGSKARQEGTKEELLASFDGTLREDANSMVALHEKHASNAVRTIRMIRETDLVPFTCRIHHIVCIEEFHPTGETAFQKRILPSYSLCTFLVCNQKALTTFRGNYRVCNKCRDHPKWPFILTTLIGHTYVYMHE